MAAPPRALLLSSLGKKVFLRWKFTFPTLEILNSYLGTEKFLRWNSKVPPLELKSSKRGTLFGTRMSNLLSTIQASWRRKVLDGDSHIERLAG